MLEFWKVGRQVESPLHAYKPQKVAITVASEVCTLIKRVTAIEKTKSLEMPKGKGSASKKKKINRSVTFVVKSPAQLPIRTLFSVRSVNSICTGTVWL